MAEAIRILSIQGNGVPQALASALFAEHLERQLGRPLNQVFDRIAGSLGGALVAAGLHCGHSALEIRDWLEDQLPSRFSRGARLFNHWIGSNLAYMLRLRHDPERFFEGLQRLIEPAGRRGRLILSATGAYDATTASSAETAHRNPSRRFRLRGVPVGSGVHLFDGPATDDELWQALRASATDARLFPPWETTIDGERWFFCNTRSSATFAALDPDEVGRKTTVVVLGAGAPRVKVGFRLRLGGVIGWAPVIEPAMLSSSADIDDRQTANMVGHHNFFKMQTEIPSWARRPDDVRRKTLRRIVADTRAALQKRAWQEEVDGFLSRHW